MMDSTPPTAAGQSERARSLDRGWLASWIQARHLSPAALNAYNDSFSSHPARLVVIKDFLQPHVAERLHRFLAHEAEFRPEYGVYSVEGAVPEEQWRAAAEDDRFFRLRKLVSTPAQFRMSPNALTYLQFRKAFQRDEFRDFFEAISGVALGWSDDFGAHSMIAGDYLRPHSDDNRNRRLALVIYLSTGWEPAFGGALHVVDPRGNVTEVHPEFNSVIAFDVLAAPAHVVLPITAAAGQQSRLTIGGWYHKGN